MTLKPVRAVQTTISHELPIYLLRGQVMHMKEHFGNDALGRSKAWNFLPWHFDFFHRYRCVPLPLSTELKFPCRPSIPYFMADFPHSGGSLLQTTN